MVSPVHFRSHSKWILHSCAIYCLTISLGKCLGQYFLDILLNIGLNCSSRYVSFINLFHVSSNSRSLLSQHQVIDNSVHIWQSFSSWLNFYFDLQITIHNMHENCTQEDKGLMTTLHMLWVTDSAMCKPRSSIHPRNTTFRQKQIIFPLCMYTFLSHSIAERAQLLCYVIVFL